VHNDAALFLRIAKQFPSVSNIFYLHQDPALIPDLETPRQRWAFLNKAGAIVCSSDYVRRRFLTGLEAARTNHVHVIYHGAALQDQGPKERLILFVGRIVAEKGLAELVQAAQLLLPHHPQWRLLVVGSSPTKPTPHQKSYLHNVHSNLKKLGRQAIWLDTQPHDKLQQLYGRASISVVPSIAPEPVARTAIEALAAGSALVSSGHGALYEILGNSGVVVDPVTPQGLALALQGLIEDQNTLYSVQRDCLERAAHFAQERCQHQIDQLRRSLLSVR
jgi:glycosyltransferase involved in cell wall biosynthesis